MKLRTNNIIFAICALAVALPAGVTAGPTTPQAGDASFIAFQGKSLVVRHSVGRLRIEPSADAQIHFSIRQGRAASGLIKAKAQNGILIIEGPKIGPARRAAAPSFGLLRTSARAASRASEVSDDAETVIAIPPGGSVALDRVAGQIAIGDTGGPLNVTLMRGAISVGRVGDAMLKIMGRGDIRVSEINGDLDIQCHGKGDVKIGRGAVERLNVNIQGSGDVSVGARVQHAQLSINGSGDIDVSAVTNQPRTLVSGAGAIHVGNWP